MSRLALGNDKLASHYDVVVVGSGYGGGVAASRLARLGLSVAVLERGREVLPGEFPRDVLSAQRETQTVLGSHRLGTPTGVFELHVGKGAHVLVGCGLGGTSLFNASVCIEPDPRVFADPCWPSEVRNDGLLAEGFRRARATLAPAPLPAIDRPRKLDALAASARALGIAPGRVDLHVAFEDRVNDYGVRQPACTRCGDCLGGCNVGAKTTVRCTWLADAAHHGARIFTSMWVRHVERQPDGRWRVVAQIRDGVERRMPVRAITAEAVVLGAGTIGTNEILMRSRERGLALSGMLGRRVSTNGDAVSLGYNCNVAVGSIGIGHPPRAGVPPPGPAVAGLIDLRRTDRVDDGVVLVDAGVQSAYAALMPLAMAAGGLTGKGPQRSFQDTIAAAGRVAGAALGGAYTGAVDATQVFLAIGHDDSGGEIVFADDRATIVWPHAADAPAYRRIDEIVGRAVATVGGTYVPNPLARTWLGGSVFSVHPLGGAVTGDERTHAVVDHKGRVYDGAPGAGAKDVHQGLYVVDGAVMPRSLGCHPLLTIAAFAERAMLHLARDIGRTLDVAPAARAA